MARDDGKAGCDLSFDDMQIGAADAASFDLEDDLAPRRNGLVPARQSQGPPLNRRRALEHDGSHAPILSREDGAPKRPIIPAGFER